MAKAINNSDSTEPIGSGVLVAQGQRIITNRHVVAGGRNFYIRYALGDTSAARVYKLGSNDDLAVLGLDKPFFGRQSFAPRSIL